MNSIRNDCAAESASGTPGRFGWLRAPIVAWIVVVAIAATLLSVYGYRSVSGDSNFYNELVMKLSQAPVSQWIAPKWGDNPHGPSPEDRQNKCPFLLNSKVPKGHSVANHLMHRPEIRVF